ncbi:MAG: Holliday junction branch migration protein RuvA [Bacilli bacterium]
MYHFLKGKIDEQGKDYIILNVNNVGYFIFLATMKMFNINEEVKVLIYTVFREDEQYLIGFNTKEEKDMFNLLLLTKGVGPKTAINILRSSSVNLLKEAIVKEDINYLKSIPTLGAKVAQQIIFDLKNKVISESNILTTNQYNKMNEVRNVLRSFGYKNYQIESELVTFKQFDMDLQEIIKILVNKLTIKYGNK